MHKDLNQSQTQDVENNSPLPTWGSWLLVILIVLFGAWYFFKPNVEESVSLEPDNDKPKTQREIVNSNSNPTNEEFLTALGSDFPLTADEEILNVGFKSLDEGDTITSFVLSSPDNFEVVSRRWQEYTTTMGLEPLLVTKKTLIYGDEKIVNILRVISEEDRTKVNIQLGIEGSFDEE